MIDRRSQRLLLVPILALGLWAAIVILPELQRPTVIGNLPIGDRVPCGDICDRYFACASAELDASEPGHPAVDHAELRRTNYRNAAGEQILTMRSGGGDFIVVFRLADGSARSFHTAVGAGVDPDYCRADDRPPDHIQYAG